MALAEGASEIVVGELTMHTKTAIWVAENLTEAKFVTTDLDDGAFRITCKGVGFTIEQRNQ